MHCWEWKLKCVTENVLLNEIFSEICHLYCSFYILAQSIAGDCGPFITKQMNIVSTGLPPLCHVTTHNNQELLGIYTVNCKK